MTYIIAEIGTNHDGSCNQALDLVSAALETGVDAVKMQLFHADKLVRKDAPPLPHAKTHVSQYERMRSLELPFWVYESASNMCRAKGKHFIVSAFDPESLLSVSPLCDKIKVASGDITYKPILQAAKDSGKPVILSTGMATGQEIFEAVDFINPWAVLHCVSLYPCPPEKAALTALYDTPMGYYKTGYSDHTIGMTACIAAAALGAEVIEKHFTLGHQNDYGDHPHSADPFEMEFIVDSIRDVEKLLSEELRLDFEARKYLRRGPDGLRGSYVCE